MSNQDISLCQYTPWSEVKREYIGVVTDNLPINAPWRYKLTVKYNKALKKISGNFLKYGSSGEFLPVVLPPGFTENSAEIYSFELKDGVKGSLRDGFHYIVIGDGTIYFNGSFPYSELEITIKWINKSDALRRINTFTIQNVVLVTTTGENKFRKKSTVSIWNISYLKNAEGETLPTNLRDLASYLKSTPTIIRNLNGNSYWKEEGVIYEVVRRGVTSTSNDWTIFIEVLPGITDRTGIEKYIFLDTKNTNIQYQKILEYFNMSDVQFRSAFTLNPINTNWTEIINAQREVRPPNQYEYVHKIAEVKYKPSGKKDRFNMPSSDSQDLPNGSKLFAEWPNKRVQIPHKPCFDGEEVFYEIDESYKVFYEKKCIGDLTVRRQTPDLSIQPVIKFQDIASAEANALRDRLTELNEEITKVQQEIVDLQLSNAPNLIQQANILTARIDTLETQYRDVYIELQTKHRRVVTDTSAQYLVEGISLIDNPIGSQWAIYGSSSLQVVSQSITEYINHARNEDLPDCDCIDFSLIGEPVATFFPECGCRMIQREIFYKVCPDQVLESTYEQYYTGRRTPLVEADLVPRLRDNILTGILTGSISPIDPVANIIISSTKCADPLMFRTERTFWKFPTGSIFTSHHPSIAGNIFGLSETGSCYFTSSLQTSSSKDYYYNVVGCQTCNEKPYFAVSYGHVSGSGSKFIGIESSDTPSRSIYSQYNLITSTSDTETNLYHYYTGSKIISNQIYVINFYQNYFEDKLSPGNFQINLSELNGISYSNSIYTGSNVAVSSSNKIIHLIDNSDNKYQEYDGLDTDPYVSFDIVSGSIVYGAHNSGTGSISTNPNITTYGKVYPNLGIVILDGNMLNEYVSFNTVTGSNINGDNSYKLLTSLSGSNVLNNPLIARNVKTRTIKNYLIQVPVTEANYTNNPTFSQQGPKPFLKKRTGPGKGRIFINMGTLKYDCFSDNPIVYITTIGLYNDKKELLAVAKLSKPIKKTFQTELNIKVRLGL